MKINGKIKTLIWNFLFKKQYDEEMSVLNSKINGFNNNISKLNAFVNELIGSHEEVVGKLTSKITELNSYIKILEEDDEGTVKPDWLSTAKKSYQPKIRIVNETIEKVISLLEPQDIYTKSAVIKRISNENNLKKLCAEDKEKCAKEIWRIVIQALKYENDKVEDWRFSPITYYYKKGDCEDGTILFVDLAREAGFKSDEVFNATGWVYQAEDKFGHSWPILNYGEGWYIYESTLDGVPAKPKKFKGSEYEADWGVANWTFSGHIIGDNQL